MDETGAIQDDWKGERAQQLVTGIYLFGSRTDSEYWYISVRADLKSDPAGKRQGLMQCSGEPPNLSLEVVI